MAVPKSKSSFKKRKNRMNLNSLISPINAGIVGMTIYNMEMLHMEIISGDRPYRRMSKNYHTRISNRDKIINRKRKIKKKYYYRLK